MEPENDGLEDGFSFSIRWFLGSMLIFRGVQYQPQKMQHLESKCGNSHVLVYHGPLLNYATFWEWLAIYFHGTV